jgi:hypothetical protein
MGFCERQMRGSLPRPSPLPAIAARPRRLAGDSGCGSAKARGGVSEDLPQDFYDAIRHTRCLVCVRGGVRRVEMELERFDDAL